MGNLEGDFAVADETSIAIFRAATVAVCMEHFVCTRKNGDFTERTDAASCAGALFEAVLGGVYALAVICHDA